MFFRKNGIRNKNVRKLYDYLATEFNIDDLEYQKSYVLSKFNPMVREFNDIDWMYFEANIHLWDSETLMHLALVITEISRKKLNSKIVSKVYCLAFIHCSYDDVDVLFEDLYHTLPLMADVEEEILRKVIVRLDELQTIEAFAKHYTEAQTIEKTKDFILQKLQLTIEVNSRNN